MAEPLVFELVEPKADLSESVMAALTAVHSVVLRAGYLVDVRAASRVETRAFVMAEPLVFELVERRADL